MKIAYIAAGAAGMYCGSCMRDNALATAMQNMGHEVALIPTYTPLRTDEPTPAIDRVFYNGINVYLQQKLGFFRRPLQLLDRLLASKRVIGILAGTDAATNAKDLGELTVSVLRGEDGYQASELDKLVQWLRDEYQPDLVQITNSMLIGMAHNIREALNVPVICAVQGEDIFLDDLIEPYKAEAMALLREKVHHVDGLIATSAYYADYMSDYLKIDRKKVHAVRIGINLDGHGLQTSPPEGAVVTIGYLARICPEKGLHLLVEAFEQLVKRFGKTRLRLRVAGYLGKRDHEYFAGVQQSVKDSGLSGQVDWVGEVDREEKINFLNSLDILSVPTPYVEPKGLFLLEAMANGVPAVQPAHGAFPEILKATEGGLLVEPNSPEALAEGLAQLVESPQLRRDMGEKGKIAVHRDWHSGKMAEETLAVYEHYIGKVAQVERR